MNKVPKLIKMTIIAARRRRGDVTKVSVRTGYSISYCSRVIRGICNNKEILNEAYRMTRRRLKNSKISR